MAMNPSAVVMNCSFTANSTPEPSSSELALPLFGSHLYAFGSGENLQTKQVPSP
eukprot:CAMPEP_0118633840 /NCGR_PEP_ID=MMETSP0785-20121206/1215_1 /TAXON_ID=91992 /ORGANISM="Bolidomonas pacifica, Strain CCMP 1866" /LENGTH=53 /DNA_ID=CAMNT_0006524749 /DNA_START=143 /DNA_END=304 /DNA_ORIENTATION=+